MVDGGNGTPTVTVSITGEVLLVNNHTQQLDPLFRAGLGSGSALARLRLWARFCADAACMEPVAVVRAVVQGEDTNGYYVYSTAGTSGTGFSKAFTIPRAPAGTTFVQLVGDSEAGDQQGKGSCSSVLDCPGDLDVVQTAAFAVGGTDGGTNSNPLTTTVQVDVTGAGANIALSGIQYLGHLRFDGSQLWEPVPADPGTLLVAMSNEVNSARNFLARVELAGAPGMATSSVALQKQRADFAGDICGMVRGGTSLFVIGVDADGANVFELSAVDGTQVSDTPIVVIPPLNPSDPATYPWPCRGVYVDRGSSEHLYLVQFKGAGALEHSRPYPLVHVDITAGTYETALPGYGDWALRAAAFDEGNSRLVLVDMCWSLDAVNNNIFRNRFVSIPVDGAGMLGSPSVSVTNRTSDDTCESTNHWPSDLVFAQVGGVPRILMGHDTGISVHSVDMPDGGVADLVEVGNLDLPTHGRLYSQLTVSGPTLHALPQCKARTSNSTFTLPYATGTEPSDSYMVAVVDLSGGVPATANTGIDVNSDGTPDNGIDLDFWHVKNYVRSFGSTLPIPPVVFTAPQFAVGSSILAVRGTGIQGNGSAVLSSSGLGQAQDVAIYDLATGRGYVLNAYMPFFDGLSSGAGTTRAIWGWDAWSGQESSVGWIEYLP